MRIKRFISLVLALVMVLGSLGVVSADTATTTSAETDPNVIYARLVNKGILVGDKGDLALDRTLTRAEFAVIALRLKGEGFTDEETVAKNIKPDFTDVKATAWYAPYIGRAQKEGLVEGHGNGTFGPNDDVRYVEALTMVMRALGYVDGVDLKNYPTGYYSRAKEIGLGKSNIASDTKILREVIADMLETALDLKVKGSDLTLAQKLEGTSIVLKDGTYEGEGQGFGGAIKVQVVVKDGKISSVKILSHGETPGISDNAIKNMPGAIVEAQSTDVDNVSGATFSSKGIKEAVKNALANAEDDTASGGGTDNKGEDKKSASPPPTIGLKDGSYEGTGKGFKSTIKAQVVIKDGKISSVKVLEHGDTANIAEKAVNALPGAIVEAQSADVDNISGATGTSKGIKEAVDSALLLAQGKDTNTPSDGDHDDHGHDHDDDHEGGEKKKDQKGKGQGQGEGSGQGKKTQEGKKEGGGGHDGDHDH